MTSSDKQKSTMVQDAQEVEQGRKKPYHTPTLRVCGTVKQHTQLGGGVIPDGITLSTWTPSGP